MTNVDILIKEYSGICRKYINIYPSDAFCKKIIRELSLKALEGMKDSGWNIIWLKEANKEMMKRKTNLGEILYANR